MTKNVLAELRPYIRGRTLDVGAGTGKYASLIRETATEYLATDVTQGPKIDVVASAEKLPFPDASFDTVVCTQVMEHLPHPWIAATEMARVLRPGGHVIVTAPFMQGSHADPSDFFRYTPAGLAALFPELEICECRAYGGTGLVLSEAWKFSVASPYRYPHPGFIRRNLARTVQRICATLDHVLPFSSIFFSASLLVAQKPEH